MRSDSWPSHITTTPATKAAGWFPDLVVRRFTADAPKRLWVADITFVATQSGFAYMAFVADAFSRKMVGWNDSTRITTESLPLQELDIAQWGATHHLSGLVHHANHGSQYLSMRYSERVAGLGIQASTGSVGASYDNALAETINSLFNTELIKSSQPWHIVEEVELATSEWVWWFNNTRPHSELGYRTPKETENPYYDSQRLRQQVSS